jgi:hypothetical protein
MGIVKRTVRKTSKKAVFDAKAKPMNEYPMFNDHILEKEVVNKMRKSNYLMAKELDTNRQDLNNLKEILADHQSRIAEFTVAQELADHREKRMTQECDLLKRENSIFKRENFSLKSENDEICNKRKNEGFSLLENQNLKAEIQRLFQMLKTTKDYKNFSAKADASGSINYLTSIGKFTKVDLASNYKELKNLDCHRPDLFVDEKVLWVPSEAFKFAHEFRIKHEGKLSDTLIEHLLFELNKVWSKRETRLLGMTKQKYSTEAESLRRKLAMTPSLELNQALKEIKRLKIDLKTAYKENRDAFAERTKRTPAGVKQIHEALKMANNHCTHKIKMRRENEYYANVTKAYQKALTGDNKGNLF